MADPITASLVIAGAGAAVGAGTGLLGHHQRSQAAQRVAAVQRQDAERVRDEFYMQAEDYTRAGEYRRGRQVSAYAASGVKLQGSPLARLLQTTGRIRAGAGRLRQAGDMAYDRGMLQAGMTEDVGSPALAFAGGALQGFQAFGGPAALAEAIPGMGQRSAPGLGIGAGGSSTAPGYVPPVRHVNAFEL